jgi:hypothetical protein
MNATLEHHLAVGMHAEVAELSPPTGVLARATRNHRRRTAAIRLGYGLGVVSLAGALAVGIGVHGGSTPTPDATVDAPTARALSPSVRLANAATASDNVSYQVTLTITAGTGAPAQVYRGAFDPNTDSGHLALENEYGIMYELLVNGTRYIGTERRPDDRTPDGTHEPYGVYGEYPGKHDRLSFGLSQDPVVLGTTADPAGLFAALRTVQADITENPDGTLHFEYAEVGTDSRVTHRGDVTLDRDGRIARVHITTDWQSTAKGRLDSGTLTRTLDLSDYGTEVKVTRPIRVVPAN